MATLRLYPHPRSHGKGVSLPKFNGKSDAIYLCPDNEQWVTIATFYNRYPCFPDKETEAQQKEVSCQTLLAGEKAGFNSGVFL